jgi:hypothetical protein
VLTSLGIGEAVVTVMDERGAPTPVAWTRLRAPESLMAPAEPDDMDAVVTKSALQGKYATTVDRESAHEMLAARLEAGAAKAQVEQREAQREDTVSYPQDSAPKKSGSPKKAGKGGAGDDLLKDALQSKVAKDLMRTAAREIARGVFKIGRR